MADIDLERDTSSSTSILPWIIGLAVLALAAWGLAEMMDSDEPTGAVADEPAETRTVTEMERTPAPGAEATSLAGIVESPDDWVGRSVPGGVYAVASVPTDRGFWIAEDDTRLMVILIDEPREQPKDINTDAHVRITGGTLRDPSYLPRLPGVPATEATLSMARAQDIFLVVDERNVDIAQDAASS